MSERRIGRLALLAAICLQAAGCSIFSSDKKAQVAPLTDVRPGLNVATTWRLAVGSARESFLQPAVLESAIFVAAADGAVLRVAPASGAVQWRTETGATLSAGVAADGFTVAVATPRGEVIALGADGKLLWRAQVPSDVTAPPLVGHGLVLVRSTDQRISAFEADSGKRRWVYTRQTPPLTLRASTEMAFAGENLIVGFPGGRMVAIALSNGAARWEASVAEPKGTTEVERLADVLGPVAVAGAQACAAAFQGRVMCADAAGGALRWARELAAGSGVAQSSQGVYVVDAESNVHALAAQAGASLWKNDRLKNRRLTTPLAASRAIVVGDLAGHVHFLAPADGAIVARVQLDSSAIVAPPRAWADGVVVLTQDGTLALLTPQP